MDSPQDGAARVETLAGSSRFRREFYSCPTLRADALFEPTDAVLCTDGPVVSLPELSIAEVHRRGHGAMYDALVQGHIAVSRLRMAPAGLRLPRGADGQLSIALDVTAWPRPADRGHSGQGAESLTSPGRPKGRTSTPAPATRSARNSTKRICLDAAEPSSSLKDRV